MTTKPKAIVLVAPVASAFDRLCKELDEAERRNVTHPTEAEFKRRMKQGKQIYRSGGMSAQSLSGLHQIMRRGHLPHHLAQALDRATGE